MGKLQAKLGLAFVLSKFNVEFNDKSMGETELTFDPLSITLAPGKKLDLKVTMR